MGLSTLVSFVLLMSFLSLLLFYFIHFINRIGRITAPDIPRSALHGIFGIFPVGVLVLVIEFFNQPVHICTHTLHIFLHDLENFREKGLFFLLRQSGICAAAKLPKMVQEKETFFPEIFEVMQKNMERMSADVDWLIEKFDYQNKDADWKNSKDAIQRGMQNIRGGYPADPVYKMNK